MLMPRQVLNASGMKWEQFGPWKHDGVLITPANQLIGSYRDLNLGRPEDGRYTGWEAHHVLERRDLERLNIASQFPAYPLQTCVLLPRKAHERINSSLQRAAPQGLIVKPNQLVDAYADAYRLIGDYCGGSERAIRDELMSLVESQLTLANVAK